MAIPFDRLKYRMQESEKSIVDSEKYAKVMGEFKDGTLKTAAGDVVVDRYQALAIAQSYIED